ncbi:hypothetical protein Dimus_014169 [Dionaea muscipula]
MGEIISSSGESIDHFKPQRSSSFSIISLRRSRSTVLFSDSIPAESAKYFGYERLSRSMRFSDASTIREIEMEKKSNSDSKGIRFLSRVFSSRKSNTRLEDLAAEEMKKKAEKDTTKQGMKKKKKWSSWLPDPDRRWPVQGW